MVDTDIAFNPLTHMGCIQKVCENQGISLAEYFQESALGIAEIIQKADKDFVAEWARMACCQKPSAVSTMLS